MNAASEADHLRELETSCSLLRPLPTACSFRRRAWRACGQARRWCQDATRLAGREWAYEKVPQKLFDGFHGDTMDELRRLLDASG